MPIAGANGFFNSGGIDMKTKKLMMRQLIKKDFLTMAGLITSIILAVAALVLAFILVDLWIYVGLASFVVIILTTVRAEKIVKKHK